MTVLKSNRKFALKRTALCALALPALLAVGQVGAKTLVYCSEGSPENFAPSINTTGTSFDASEQIYDNLVDFERGGTKVVPGLDGGFVVLGQATSKMTIAEMGELMELISAFGAQQGVRFTATEYE